MAPYTSCMAILAMVLIGVSIGSTPVSSESVVATDDALLEDYSNAVISIASLCETTTLFTDTCKQTLAGGGRYSALSVIQQSLQSAKAGTIRTRLALQDNPTITALDDPNPFLQSSDVCSETLEYSQDYIDAALTELGQSSGELSARAMSNIKAWVSAAMEFHTTCIDAAVSGMGGAVDHHVDQLFSNGLAFVNAMSNRGTDMTSWTNTAATDLDNDLNSVVDMDWVPEYDLKSVDVPDWVELVSSSDDVRVAKDGTGDYRTIQDAVNAHKVNNDRLVIYVAAGTYYEQVKVPTTCKYLTIVGAGEKTVITGNKNVALMPNMTTYHSATLSVAGSGFIGKSFNVVNTAGSAGQQAVAFRGSADQIAMYNVTFDGYQDTLYAHAGRQFYRDCTIRGTVDMIFGNGAAAFQNCKVVAKRTTLLGQQNTYCAQGRTDPNQNTGLSFHNCVFDAIPGVKANTTYYKTYLGRPWKAYSRSVLLKSELMGHIDPTGWLPWNTSTFGLYTSYFAEYQSSGAGANPNKRVGWSKQIALPSFARKYIATNFVQAGSWLPRSRIPFTTTL